MRDPEALVKGKRPKGPSPTARTMAELRRRGWLAQGVEQVIPHTFIKRDLFGFGDVAALDGLPGVLLIQATSDNGGNVAARAAKIRTECREAAQAWLDAGNRIQVWGWAKRGAAGTRKLWTLRIVEITTTAGRGHDQADHDPSSAPGDAAA